MRVNTISARIKASKEVNGCWKTIEFGAEAVLDSGDDWKESQDQLFADLTSQLKKAFSPSHRDPKGNGRKPAPPVDSPQPPIPEGSKTDKARKKKGNGKPETKMCPIHNAPMKLWTNENGGSWYSHNDETTGGEWCSGKPKKKGKKK